MIRTPVRRFATTVRRAAETLQDMEGHQAHAIQISKAQRVAEDGFVSGMIAQSSRFFNYG